MDRPGLVPEYGAERNINSVRRRLAAIEKAERMLNFRTKIGLKEGLNDLVDWWRAERVGSVPEKMKALAS
jgi:UDP-glucose 4-epimerase